MNHAGLLDLIRSCLWTVPFVLLCLHSGKINLKRSQRVAQYPMVFLSVVYCVPAVLMIDRILNGLMELVRWLAALAGLIPGVGAVLSGLLSMALAHLLQGYGVQMLANTALVLAFCLFKRIALPVCKKLYQRFPAVYGRAAEWFYEKRPGDPWPMLKEHCRQLRDLLHVFYYAFIALGAVDILLVLQHPSDPLYSYPLYPVFAVLVMGECSFFLGGYTRMEHAALGGGAEEEDETDLEALRLELERLFGDRLLYQDSWDAAPLPPPKEEENLLEKLGSSPEAVDQITSSYFSNKIACGAAVEQDTIQGALALMQGRSVLFCDPFYRDLTNCLMLPVVHQLLNHHKVLVVTGRCAGGEDVIQWVREGLERSCNLQSLWSAAWLEEKGCTGAGMPDVGLLRFNDLYNMPLQQDCADFFRAVSLVILLEPSNLMGTGQIGLRTICQLCENGDKQPPVYAACDRNVDGLIDALSHTLRQSLVEVMASPIPRSRRYQMFWAAEEVSVAGRILPRISRYLGFGTELSAVALRHGIRQAHWYSDNRIPMQDMRWSAEQYTAALCGYVGCRAEQSTLDQRIRFENRLWQAERMANAFVIVEDECSNLFELARVYAAHGDGTSFVNILSENYLLRDYMRCNAEMMENDPKAIPALCPDFARTERNTVLRLLLMMTASPQEESLVKKELILCGHREKDVYRAFCGLLVQYTDLPEDIVRVIYREEPDELGAGTISRKYVSVIPDDFRRLYDEVLRPACFVVENEQSGRSFMGARMMGQVTQSLLPGQFFCYDGRYYQMQRISREEGMVVRRAADHIVSRQCYRQLRSYRLTGLEPQGDVQDLRGLSVQVMQADMEVETSGYYVMRSRENFSTAHRVELVDQPVRRSYRRKEVLRVLVPEARLLYPLSVLLNELFVTLYPGGSDFLVAAASGERPGIPYGEALAPSLDCEGEPALYILEDCFMDLGLLVSAERNLRRILEILTDYLDWYRDPGRERWGEALHPGEEAEDSRHAPAPAQADCLPVLREEGIDFEGEDERVMTGEGAKERRCTLREYLTYGGQEDASFLELDSLYEFLCGHGFLDSLLHRTRTGDPEIEEYIRHIEAGDHLCDFCGAPMEPGRFTILKDGRERCPACDQTAVRRARDVKKLFLDTRREMEQTFGISIRCPIKVRSVNAQKIAAELGREFKPTGGMDGRTLGFARQRARGGRELYLENGSPRDALTSTIVHELTHIWQYENWGDKIPSSQENLPVYEGMAVWTEIQMMLSHGQAQRAKRYEYLRLQIHDEYGDGLRMYKQHYPFQKGNRIGRNKSPFGRVPPV